MHDMYSVNYMSLSKNWYGENTHVFTVDITIVTVIVIVNYIVSSSHAALWLVGQVPAVDPPVAKAFGGEAGGTVQARELLRAAKSRYSACLRQHKCFSIAFIHFSIYWALSPWIIVTVSPSVLLNWDVLKVFSPFPDKEILLGSLNSRELWHLQGINGKRRKNIWRWLWLSLRYFLFDVILIS